MAGLNHWRAERQLRSDARSALYAREGVQRDLKRAVAIAWPAVAGVASICVAAAVLVAVFGRGPTRWVVVGIVLASAAWASAIFVLLLSGVAPRMMGVVAEQWTSADLRRMKRHGWRLINGVTMRRSDVDHVLIGPGGVLVVETKWSSEAWPVAFDESDSYIARTLRNAVAQSSRNRARIADVLRDVPGNALHGVVVLWSAGAPGTDPATPYSKGNVSVVPGLCFAEWLNTWSDTASPTLDVAAAFRTMAAYLETERQRTGESDLAGRPTFLHEIWRILIEPVLAVCGVGVLLLVAAATHRLDVVVIELVVSPLVGLASMRWRRVRPAALAWFGSALAAAIAVPVLLLQVSLH